MELSSQLKKLIREEYEQAVEQDPTYNRYATALIVIFKLQQAIADIVGEP